MTVVSIMYKNKQGSQCAIYGNTKSLVIADVMPENKSYTVQFMCYDLVSASYILIEQKSYTWRKAYRAARLFALLAIAPRTNDFINDYRQTTDMSMAKSHRKVDNNRRDIERFNYAFRWQSSSFNYKTFYFRVSNPAVYIAKKLGMRIKK